MEKMNKQDDINNKLMEVQRLEIKKLKLDCEMLGELCVDQKLEIQKLKINITALVFEKEQLKKEIENIKSNVESNVDYLTSSHYFKIQKIKQMNFFQFWKWKKTN